MDVEIKIEGLKEIDRKLSQLPKNLGRRALLNAIRPAARMVRDDIKARSPVGETGDHKKSIKVKARRQKYTKQYHVQVAVGGDYKSNWLEYGTSRMAAQPHFRPAADAKRGEARKMMVDAIMGAINKVWKR